MNHVKITQAGWAGFTGHLNIVHFTNGVSDEPVPEMLVDRIAAAVSLVACDAKGEVSDETELGIQNRLVGGVTARAEIATELSRQSDQDKALELRVDADKVLSQPSEKLYTKEELEAVADKGGIKAIREISNLWSLKGRSIPELIEATLKAQADFLARRAIASEQVQQQKLTHTTRASEVEVEAVVEEVTEPLAAEGLAAEYTVDGKLVRLTSLTALALKNCGKSLTGWNKLTDKERFDFISEEIAALEKHTGKELVPVVAKDAKQEVKEVVTDGSSDGDTGAAGGGSDGDSDSDASEGDASEEGTPDGADGAEQSGSDEKSPVEGDESEKAE